MEYKDFKKSNLFGAYLFYGDEKLLMDYALEYVESKYVAKEYADFNYFSAQGKDLDIKKIINVAETLPLLSEKKLAIIKDCSLFLVDNELEKGFYDFLDSLAEHCIIIFVEGNEKLKKTTKFYKYFAKNNRSIEFPKLKGGELNLFIENYLRKHNREMNRSTITYFIEKSNYLSRNINRSLLDLKGELDKLVSVGSSKTIGRDIVERYSNSSIDENIFDFLNSLSSKNKVAALVNFKHLYDLNEPIQKILIMFIRQVRLLLSYKLLKEENFSDGEIQKNIGIKSYEYSKISISARRFSTEFLKYFYEELLEVDRKFKTTAVDEYTVMETLIIKFCKEIAS